MPLAIGYIRAMAMVLIIVAGKTTLDDKARNGPGNPTIR